MFIRESVTNPAKQGLINRLRLDFKGNLHIDSVLQIASVTQQRSQPQAAAYLARNVTKCKTRREARRAHKRHPAEYGATSKPENTSRTRRLTRERLTDPGCAQRPTLESVMVIMQGGCPKGAGHELHRAGDGDEGSAGGLSCSG